MTNTITDGAVVLSRPKNGDTVTEDEAWSE